jgi:hypothetical protein
MIHDHKRLKIKSKRVVDPDDRGMEAQNVTMEVL